MTMQDIYLLNGVSKQGHHQSLQRERAWQDKAVFYIALMHEIREVHPAMGLRTMYDMSQPEGIGRDGFILLGLQAGFRVQIAHNPTRTTFSIPSRRYPNLLEGREFTDVNQLWTSDITYFYFQGKYYYIVLIMDVYSRRIIGWSVADNMRAENNVAALRMALILRGVKNYHQTLIHHSDRGAQYTSDAYTELLTEYGILISMCQEVYENAHIERANGTIKNQYLKHYSIPNEKALLHYLNKAIEAYNVQKPHQALDGISPIQFENNLKELKIEDRIPLKVFTISKQFGENYNTAQLYLEL
jgi:putative transposase